MDWKKTSWYGLLTLTTLAYLTAGIPKLFAFPMMLDTLAGLGYGRLFTVFIGGCWTAAAIGLWSECHQKAAALGTLFIVAGAFAAHWTNGDGVMWPLFGYVVLSTAVLYGNDFFDELISK
jgi:hypothetical protein